MANSRSRGCLTYLVLAALIAGAGALWAHQSIYFTLFDLGRAAKDRDVAKFEKYVDLDMVVSAGGTFVSAMTKEGSGGGIFGDIAGAVLGGIAKGAMAANASETKKKIRRQIALGEVDDTLGIFQPDDETPLSVKERLGDVYFVNVHGKCGNNDATIEVLFTRVPGPFGLGVLGHWRATDVSESSLRELAKACAK